MLSMTGYGYAERLTDEISLTVEVKSYNNRYLEINHMMPNSLSRFEAALDERIKAVARRGHVELNIRMRQLSSDINLHVDMGALEQYRAAFDQISTVTGTKEATLADYAQADGVIVSVRDSDVSRYEQLLFELLDTALVDFSIAKEREGEATRKNLQHLGTLFQQELDVVVSYAQELEERLKQSLLNRFDELLGSRGYDEHRFLQEVALLLAKYSVNEEIERLKTHLAVFHELLDTQDSVGKRLDFLCQEMNREVNTIGSKSIIVEVNQHVVGMKDSLENIREQVRNIE
jgi:uncharacterized protein (TIGR00255 family)